MLVGRYPFQSPLDDDSLAMGVANMLKKMKTKDFALPDRWARRGQWHWSGAWESASDDEERRGPASPAAGQPAAAAAVPT